MALYKAPTLSELDAVMKLPFEPRRAAYRKIAKDFLRTDLDHRAYAKRIVQTSPLFGEGDKQIKCRPTTSAIVDVLDIRALAYVAETAASKGGDVTHAWTTLEYAMTQPEKLSVPGGGRTGYAIGVRWSTSAEESVHLRVQDKLKAQNTTTQGNTTMSTNTATTTTSTAMEIAGGMKLLEAYQAVELLLAPAVNKLLADGKAGASGVALGNAVSALKTAIDASNHDGFDAFVEVGKEQLLKSAADYFGEPKTWNEVSAAAVNDYSSDVIALAAAVIRENGGLLVTDQMDVGIEDGPGAFDLEDDEVSNDAGNVATFKTPTFDPNLKSALDGLFKAAAGMELDTFMEELKGGAANVEGLQREVQELRRVAASTASAPAVQSYEAKGDGTIPDTKMEYKKAWEIFAPEAYVERVKAGKAKPMAALDFDFPVFPGWENGGHPDVDLIDPDYIFDPDTLAPTLWAILNNKPIWLQGHTGAGKSTLIKQIGARTGYPVIRVNLDSEITRLDLVGRDTLLEQGGSTISKFVEGVIPTAMQSPCILLLDEADFGRSDVMYVIQSVLEADGMRITEDGGRWVRPHPMFRITATGNTKGQGDEYGCYQGARVQSAALLDRFQVWLTIPYLSQKDEVALIGAKVPGIDKARSEQLVKLATAVRKAFVGGEILTPATPRGLTTAAAMFMSLKPSAKTEIEAMQKAISHTISGKASDTDRAKIQELVAAHIA